MGLTITPVKATNPNRRRPQEMNTTSLTTKTTKTTKEPKITREEAADFVNSLRNVLGLTPIEEIGKTIGIVNDYETEHTLVPYMMRTAGDGNRRIAAIRHAD
jgi:hypothetical protein